MDKILVNSNKKIAKIKPMNAVNNGPITANFELYREMEIPYARNHDAAFCSSYGGEHTVDITAIFPDFEKDEYDESSYDFCVTDKYLKDIESAGTKVFYRLGQKIDHRVKKYDNKVPEDFKKWAVICEHIVRHYNEGWANGFHMNIEYWEIWNEPNLGWAAYADDAELDDVALGWKRAANEPSKTWDGTREQYYELYKITAAHLKKCFPKIKVGGPALVSCGMEDPIWCNGFFKALTEEERIPLDFYSWHVYTTTPKVLKKMIEFTRNKLDEYGYTQTESILDEWNYVKGWDKANLVESYKTIHGIKGAALVAAAMCYCQNSSLDMLMYYDFRPTQFCGVFDFYTYEPLKTFYVYKTFAEMKKIGNQTECVYDIDDIYALSAADENGSEAVMISYYTDEKEMPDKEFELEFMSDGKNIECYILDEESDMKPIGRYRENKIRIEMKPNTVMYIKRSAD